MLTVRKQAFYFGACIIWVSESHVVARTQQAAAFDTASELILAGAARSWHFSHQLRKTNFIGRDTPAGVECTRTLRYSHYSLLFALFYGDERPVGNEWSKIDLSHTHTISKAFAKSLNCVAKKHNSLFQRGWNWKLQKLTYSTWTALNRFFKRKIGSMGSMLPQEI